MKYVGSKARFAKFLAPIMNEALEEREFYFEPFVGGANLIQHIRKDKTLVGSDSNEYLIRMWEALQTGELVPHKVTREEYKEVRLNKDVDKALSGWVGFNCSYSGKFFGGFAGETKTKIGTVRDYQQEAINNILKQLPELVGVKFLHKSYEELEIPSNSVVYCDPPYKDTTGYKDSVDYEHFYEWLRQLSRNGVKVFVSEYSMPSDFKEVWRMETKSSLSANGLSGTGSKKSVEKLFTL